MSKEGINVDLANIESIHYCYMPMSITKVYSFIGFASYFIRFVEVFSTIAVPLNLFIHKDVTFVWSEESEMRFWKLKELFITTIILTLPVDGDGFMVYYDASRVGLGCVFMQRGHVISHIPQQIKHHEQNYPIH